MTEKRIPLRKKFPGQHVTRATIWMPSGSSIGFEGSVEKEAAELFIACLVRPDRITPAMRDMMTVIVEQLTPKDPKP